MLEDRHSEGGLEGAHRARTWRRREKRWQVRAMMAEEGCQGKSGGGGEGKREGKYCHGGGRGKPKEAQAPRAARRRYPSAVPVTAQCLATLTSSFNLHISVGRRELLSMLPHPSAPLHGVSPSRSPPPILRTSFRAPFIRSAPRRLEAAQHAIQPAIAMLGLVSLVRAAVRVHPLLMLRCA